MLEGSKYWGTVDVFGIQNNFDLVAKDAKDGKLAIEIKFVSFQKGRMPNGEIQRFLGQCLAAATKFDSVIGVCGYAGMLNLEYDRDTENCMRWAKDQRIDLVFRSVSTEKYGEYEIEWIKIPSFRASVHGKEFDYSDRHGVILYHHDKAQKLPVGFIASWVHERGPCRIYILTADSKEWGDLLPESERILNDVKKSVYAFLRKNQFGGRIEGDIYALTNA
jgi:hypothetical protein